jgi:outer membrane protein assembly factor BamB
VANTELGHFACGPLVFTPTPDTTALPQVQGDIYALRASDGALLWHRIIGGGVDNLTLQAGILVLTTSIPGQAPALMALRASDGTRLWRQPPAGDQPASLLMAGPVIYEATGASVFAIRLMDGHLLWQRNVGDYLEGAIATDGSMIAVAGETSATALRAGDGTLLWQLPTNQSISFLCVVGGSVYLTTYPLDSNSSLVYAFPSASAAPLWHASYLGEVETPPVVLGHVLYLGARGMTQDRAMIDAFDTRTGKRLWQFQNDEQFSALSSPGTDTLYLASIDVSTSSTTQWSDLTAVRASDGTVLWRVRVPHSNVLLSQAVVG